MNLVCWDTCTEKISLTLVKEKTFFFEKKWDLSFKGGPAGFLVPAVRDICTEAELSLEQIDGLGVTQGPGSFTGIRLGLSTAYGLKAALQKPLAVQTLFDLWKIYAQNLFPGTYCWVIVKTYGAFWAIQAYAPTGKAQEEAFLIRPPLLEESIKKLQPDSLPLLVGWNVSDDIKFVDLSLEILDLAKMQINTSFLLAKYILENPLCLIKQHFPLPYYLKPPSVCV